MDDEPIRVEVGDYSISLANVEGHITVGFFPVSSADGRFRVRVVWKVPFDEATKLANALLSLSMGPPASTARN